jgi:adenylosuccinate synthase
VLYPKSINVIGNGCVIHLPTFFEELKILKENNIDTKGRIFISDRAHLIFEYHKIIDGLQEERKGKNKVGTTNRGIGPAYTDKISRIGIRVHELLDFEKFKEHLRENVDLLEKTYDFKFDIGSELAYYQNILGEIKEYIADTASMVNKAIDQGKKILMEGANATLLDIDHGTYPYVTSSNASIGGMVAGSGIGATRLKSVIGIMKAYMTRVGAGPFPTELENELGEKLRTKGGEFGSTTGRPRRCGWFDAVASKYSVMINNMSGINLTKLDVLDEMETIKIATGYFYAGKKLENFPASLEMLTRIEVEYIEMPGWKTSIKNSNSFEELPENAQKYVKKIEELLGCPINFVGTGIGRHEMIMM